MTDKTIEQAKQLARSLLEIDKKFQKIIDNNELKFDVYNDEEHGWIIQTGYCQMGGCMTSYIPCKSKSDAEIRAARMTYNSQEPDYKGLCSSCSAELYDMQI